MVTTEPFTIDISDATLTDLRERLERTRFPAASATTPWQAGVDPDYLRGLVAYWADGFDWRAQETALNDVPQFLADLGGRTLHYVHVPAAADATTRVPIVLCHGWPSAFTEMLALADRLAHPARFGASADLAFDVVIPSLPGFLFSDLPSGPFTRETVADDLHALMTDGLGFDRYAAFGGDIGGTVAAWLGAKYPERVIGIHMIHPPFPATFDEPVSVEEQAFLDAEEVYDTTDAGYSWIMQTRPDTVASALIDSPSGLAAWIVDKLRDWSDCDGDLESRFDRDTLLTLVTLYWVTESIGTSFRQYLDFEHNAPRPGIDGPAAFTLSSELGMVGYPRSIAERACSDIRFWHEPKRGGHFLAHEEPDLMAGEIREFVVSLCQ